MRDLLQQLITDSLTMPIPAYTRRDAHLPAVPDKAFAVVGMRRSGKTTFLWQCLAERLASGAPRESLLYLNFEDERLAGLQARDLQWVVEDYYRFVPHLRDQHRVTFFFDEIQVIQGWETFTRASERKRMISPRKAYPIDPGLILIYEKAGRANTSRALETVIVIELERRGYEFFYINTDEGYEIDFLAHSPEGEWLLLQICADLSNAATHEREVPTLVAASKAYPNAIPILITLDAVPPQPGLPEPL